MLEGGGRNKRSPEPSSGPLQYLVSDSGALRQGLFPKSP